jgi:thioredoxin 1
MNKIDATSYNSFINSSGTCVVMMGASWCLPCRSAKPKVEIMSDKTGVSTAYLDVDDAQNLAQSLKVMGVPTFIKFENGKEVTRLVGANDDGLKVLFGI